MDNNDYMRMVLLDESEYNILKIQHANQAPTDYHQQALDNLKHSNLAPDRYIKTYGTLMDRHANDVKDVDMKQEEEVVTDSKTDWLLKSLQQLPKSNRNRALQLYNFLLNKQPAISWNEDGEIKDADDITVPHSNIYDLINYMTNTRLIKAKVGLSEFAIILHKLNAPHSVLGTPGIAVMTRVYQLLSKSKKSESRELMHAAHDEKPLKKWISYK